MRRGDDHDAASAVTALADSPGEPDTSSQSATASVSTAAWSEPASSETAESTKGRSPTGRRWAEVLGVAWTVAVAAAVLVRALRPGVSLGPFDILSLFGLTAQPGTVHNTVLADQIQQFVPWTNLAWHQVHAGHLPLWNSYNVLGTPLAFNWQSGVFSLPVLIAYALPVSYAFTVIVLTKLVLAGLGVYVLCRVLGMGPLASAFGGSAFEVSGPMVVHAGWPHTAVTCFAGWLLAGVVLVLRGDRRLLGAVMVALSTTLAIYGGHPESVIIMALATVVFLVVYLVVDRGSWRRVVRPLGDLALAAVCGAGMGAPLLFPGAQLAAGSTRNSGSGAVPFGISHLPNLIAFGLQGKDFRDAAYCGVVVLALAAVGTRVSGRRPAVAGLAVVAVVTTLLTFFSPASKILHIFPSGGSIAWSRSVMLMALALAVLAAAGLDAVVRAPHDRMVVGWMAWSFGALAFVVVAIAVAGELKIVVTLHRHLLGLLWPGLHAVAGLALAAALWPRERGAHSRGRPRRLKRLGVPGLVALETAFLLSAGIPFWSVSSTYFAPTPAVAALRAEVGSGLVGFGTCRSLRYSTPSPNEVGIRPNANIGYGVHEMAVYDPIIPAHYYTSLLDVTRERTTPSLEALGAVCVKVLNAAQARVYGIQYVLEPIKLTRARGAVRLGPPGTTEVGMAGNEVVFAVPGSSQATVLPAPPPGTTLPTDAPGAPLVVTHPDDATWRTEVQTSAPSVVRFRLTNVPGWRATIDGRSLGLEPWGDALMLEARVPAGRHVVTLQYWPQAFSYGLVVGGVSAAALVTVVVVSVPVRRRRARTAAP